MRSRITAEQAKLELASLNTSQSIRRPMIHGFRDKRHGGPATARPPVRTAPRVAPAKVAPQIKKNASPEERKQFESVLTDLIGTRGACLLDEKLGVLGKVPLAELPSTLSSLTSGVYAVVLDESIDPDVVAAAEKARVKHIIGMDTKVKPTDARVNILTSAQL